MRIMYVYSQTYSIQFYNKFLNNVTREKILFKKEKKNPRNNKRRHYVHTLAQRLNYVYCF